MEPKTVKSDAECRFCFSKSILCEEKITRSGMRQIHMRCQACGKFIGFKKQNNDPAIWVMPIGKYAGLTLAEIEIKDSDYLLWAHRCMTERIQNKVSQYLDRYFWHKHGVV